MVCPVPFVGVLVQSTKVMGKRVSEYKMEENNFALRDICVDAPTQL